MKSLPFYDPLKTYEQNFEQGPFGPFAEDEPILRKSEPQFEFLKQPVHIPFGIPAGPIINGNFVEAAFKQGFDVCVYKTVRSRRRLCHEWPNVLPVKVGGDLKPDREQVIAAGRKFSDPLSITNSFGVPSPDPDWWQADMARAAASAGEGQILVGSFQGTGSAQSCPQDVVDDYALTAGLVAATGAKMMVANLSCPNEGKDKLLCFDVPMVKKIAFAIKEKIGDIPLLLKLAYFESDRELEQLVKQLGPIVQGFIAINTIPTKVVASDGEQALPGQGRSRSGICGAAIKWAGLDMVSRLKQLRNKQQLDFAVVGVGGVTSPADFFSYKEAGADAVLSATGAMWHPDLAKRIYVETTTAADNYQTESRGEVYYAGKSN